MSKEEYSKSLFWTEYVSNDMEKTNSFLQEMFGWKEFSRPENEVYLMHDKTPIMNIVQRSAEMERDGVPPHIKNYVSVDDYDKSKAQALEKGAKLVHEAEVSEYCKLGVLEIPGDIYLAIVQYYQGHP